MTVVAVKRLAVSTPAGRTAEARMRVEDALRLASLSDDRLFIFRRFDFGVLPQAARSTIWQARAEKTMRSLVASAVHASSPGAAESHAVWFRSQSEAQALLLALLARGIAPTAWFWQLAIGDWRGASLSEWLPRLFDRIRNDQTERVVIARALLAALSEGSATAVMTALARLPHAIQNKQPIDISEVATNTDIDSQHGGHRRLAALVMGRHQLTLQRQLSRILLDEKQDSNARYWLSTIAIVAVAAEAETNSAHMNAIVDVIQTEEFWRQFQSGVRSADNISTRRRGQSPVAAKVNEAQPPAHGRIGPEAPIVTDSQNHHESNFDDRMGDPRLRSVEKNTLSAERSLTAPEPEFVSTSAGLWLVVPALCKMGFADWLDKRNEPEFGSFGHALLAHIAQRQGVELEDPALSPVWLDNEMSDETLTVWRVGLDRWLRRRAQIRLCDLVRKRGWMRQAGADVTIRFLPEDVDIRLRRIALDLDPGWVPWLGLAVRYEYRERRFS